MSKFLLVTLLILGLLLSVEARQKSDPHVKPDFRSRHRDCPETRGLKMNEPPSVVVTIPPKAVETNVFGIPSVTVAKPELLKVHKRSRGKHRSKRKA
jgi:hypothetical protein